MLIKNDEFPIEEVMQENGNINLNEINNNKILAVDGVHKRNRICEQLIIRNV